MEKENGSHRGHGGHTCNPAAQEAEAGGSQAAGLSSPSSWGKKALGRVGGAQQTSAGPAGQGLGAPSTTQAR